MKTLYITIALLFVFSVATVATLYLIQPKPVKNGFNRGDIYTAQKLGSVELKFNNWYIKELGTTRIYLGNYIAGLNLFSCSYGLKDTLYRPLPVKDDSRRKMELLKNYVLQQINPIGDRFSRDGFICLNEAAGRMIYTYYYRNRFVCLDTAFKVLYTGKSIDTNTVAKIKLAEYKKGDKTVQTMSEPGLMVNKRGYSDEGRFYIHSDLAADNEKLEDFNKHEVFDVYALDNGKYSYSIYMPKYKGRQLTDFAVNGNKLIALYEKVIVTYWLEPDNSIK